MASVVAGLGFGVASDFHIFTSPAQAQVNNVPQPIGFADMVERVKPSVISVKVTMKQKATDTSNKKRDDETRARQCSASFINLAARWHAQKGPARMAGMVR